MKVSTDTALVLMTATLIASVSADSTLDALVNIDVSAFTSSQFEYTLCGKHTCRHEN